MARQPCICPYCGAANMGRYKGTCPKCPSNAIADYHAKLRVDEQVQTIRDREAQEILSALPQLTYDQVWSRDAAPFATATIAMHNGKLYIFPEIGGVLVVEDCSQLTGDVAPYHG